jgi:hypothetical protein
MNADFSIAGAMNLPKVYLSVDVVVFKQCLNRYYEMKIFFLSFANVRDLFDFYFCFENSRLNMINFQFTRLNN